MISFLIAINLLVLLIGQAILLIVVVLNIISIDFSKVKLVNKLKEKLYN